MQLGDDEWSALAARLRSFVRRRLHDPHAAEDVVQEVLLKAHAAPAVAPERATAWALAVARNAVIDHFRMTRRRGRSGLLETDPPAQIAPQRRADTAIASRCLPAMVRSLPRGYREALELSDLHGLPQRAVAERLGLSVPGAKSRVQRARAQLREMFLDCCRVELDGRGGVMTVEPTERSPRYCNEASHRDTFCIRGPDPTFQGT